MNKWRTLTHVHCQEGEIGSAIIIHSGSMVETQWSKVKNKAFEKTLHFQQRF